MHHYVGGTYICLRGWATDAVAVSKFPSHHHTAYQYRGFVPLFGDESHRLSDDDMLMDLFNGITVAAFRTIVLFTTIHAVALPPASDDAR